MSSESVPDTSPAQARARHSFRDMLISLGVLVVPVLAIMLLARSCETPPRNTVDATNVYASAAPSFGVVEPHPLPPGWRTVSAVVQVGTHGRKILRVGFAGPDGAVAQIVEDNPANAKVVKEELAGGLRTLLGTAQLGGQIWQRYPGRGGQLAYVSVRPRVIIILTGSAPDAELQRIAAALS